MTFNLIIPLWFTLAHFEVEKLQFSVNKENEKIHFLMDYSKELSPPCDGNAVPVTEGHSFLVLVGMQNENQNKPNGLCLNNSSHYYGSHVDEPRPMLIFPGRPVVCDPWHSEYRGEPWEDHWSDPPDSGCG